jgi:hypothetical protein
VIERELIIDYELVRGMPGDVMQRVKELIGRADDNWQPKGKFEIMDIDGHEVVIQLMVKYES